MAHHEFAAFAEKLADAAHQAILPFMNGNVSAKQKADNTPVTEADKTAESAMRTLIESTYPEHGIFGEEFGISTSFTTNNMRSAEREPEHSERGEAAAGAATPPLNHYSWVLDPIDGTRAFIAGKEDWGTLIALCENGTPIIGVLHQPTTGKRWVGIKHRPTLLNGKPCHTSNITEIQDASFSTTSANYFSVIQAAKIAQLAEQCQTAIQDGDCIAYGLLAGGARDVVIDVGIKPYDILALVPIIEGAGGTITTSDGQAITLDNAHSALACSNAALHHNVRNFLGW